MAKKTTKPVRKPVAPARKTHLGLGRGLGALIGETKPVAPVAPAPTKAPVAKPKKPVAKPTKVTQVAKPKVAAPKVEVPKVETPKIVAPVVEAPKVEEVVAVVETPVVSSVSAGIVLNIPVADIARCPWQPRVVFDQVALQELTESIKTHGVIQPLICRRTPKENGGGYELIAGERRLRAATDAGLPEVPVVVVDAVDKDAAEMAVIENIQREDLNVIEEAEGYKTLSEVFGLTQQEVADRVGKGRASVANAVRLLELPDEVKHLLSSGMLSVGHAKVLLALDNEKEQVLLARRCVTEGMTVRALEKLIARRKAEKTEANTRKQDIPEDHVKYLLEALNTRFAAPIRLQSTVTHANGKRTKGSIEIDFFDNDDLTRLLDLLGVVVE